MVVARTRMDLHMVPTIADSPQDVYDDTALGIVYERMPRPTGATSLRARTYAAVTEESERTAR